MRRFSEFAADSLRLPKDVLMDMPKISIGGDKEIFIENHKGLSLYSESQLNIKMNDGIICIFGEKLRIIVMEEDRMVINGEILRIEFEKFGRKLKNVKKNL